MLKKKYNISVEAALEVIGGKWKCVILCHLMRGKTDKRIEAAYAGHHPEDADTAIAGAGS